MDNNNEFNTNETLHETDSSVVKPDADFEFLAYLSKDKADRLLDFLKFSGIDNVNSEYDRLNDSYNVEVMSKDFEKASNLYHIFSENELEYEQPAANTTTANLYDSSTDKYKDNLSSAITFCICGTIGIIVLILNNVGIFSFINTKGSSGILMNVVLGALFIGFIIIGILSFKYSKKIKSAAEKENDISQNINAWLDKNITIDDIENSYDADIPEEMKYFSRSAYLHKVIHNKYPDVDETVTDSVVDTYIENNF